MAKIGQKWIFLAPPVIWELKYLPLNARRHCGFMLALLSYSKQLHAASVFAIILVIIMRNIFTLFSDIYFFEKIFFWTLLLCLFFFSSRKCFFLSLDFMLFTFRNRNDFFSSEKMQMSKMPRLESVNIPPKNIKKLFLFFVQVYCFFWSLFLFFPVNCFEKEKKLIIGFFVDFWGR